MKKKSKQGKKEQAPAVFSNAPFKALKGVLPSGTAPTKTPVPPAAPAIDADDDADLFLQAVRGARPVDPDSEAGEAPPGEPRPRPAAQPDSVDVAEGELFLQAMGGLGTAAVREDDLADVEGGDAPARSSSGRMRQLRRGTISISEELDLHGFLKDEALRRLGHFISSAHARGLAAVLVITGKGHNSPEGPVLPGAVSAWLREQARGMVAEFHPAPREKGGSGAYVVFLKRQRD